MSAPAASIIIVAYNSAAHLGPCLRSLVATCCDTCEIIVVENASPDTAATAALVAQFPQVRLITSLDNVGFAAGCNLGAQHATAPYLVFLNPDTVVEAGWLPALLAPLKRDPTIGMTTGQLLLLHQPDTINACGLVSHITGLTLCRGMGLPRGSFPSEQEVNAVSGAVCAIRRELFGALGGFDATYFTYVEDTDLSWRVRLAGYRCVYLPGAVVYHDYALRFGPRKTFYQERNRAMLLLKHLRAPTFVVYWPVLLLGELISWGLYCCASRTAAPTSSAPTLGLCSIGGRCSRPAVLHRLCGASPTGRC